MTRYEYVKTVLEPRFKDEDELYHHGILGMKWGVRRFQNEDGSLTPEGERRYYQNDKGKFVKRTKQQIENYDKRQERNKIAQEKLDRNEPATDWDELVNMTTIKFESDDNKKNRDEYARLYKEWYHEDAKEFGGSSEKKDAILKQQTNIINNTINDYKKYMNNTYITDAFDKSPIYANDDDMEELVWTYYENEKELD